MSVAVANTAPTTPVCRKIVQKRGKLAGIAVRRGLTSRDQQSERDDDVRAYVPHVRRRTLREGGAGRVNVPGETRGIDRVERDTVIILKFLIEDGLDCATNPMRRRLGGVTKYCAVLASCQQLLPSKFGRAEYNSYEFQEGPDLEQDRAQRNPEKQR
ncbi:hypothetical protein B0H17DRAFT_1153085 [Mycena rosella]|uniref:Uncharacterized protein n=1 Tax=Mycena rosella TaxID=1033263 RepID=A0AAD7B8J2_MYCRO|nr:hypothetical protein B0H17DRAFT_1153085 [Mycena rosella]